VNGFLEHRLTHALNSSALYNFQQFLAFHRTDLLSMTRDHTVRDPTQDHGIASLSELAE
jgi:hypothetical protein